MQNERKPTKEIRYKFMLTEDFNSGVEKTLECLVCVCLIRICTAWVFARERKIRHEMTYEILRSEFPLKITNPFWAVPKWWIMIFFG